jgi:DNA-binding PadR family transcriptional regulator
MACHVWKLKNEFRRLYEKMKTKGYMVELLNTLKNKRRLQILEIICEGQYSLETLQQRLKTLGHYHSQGTIAQEYLNPLINVGLAEEDGSKYYATFFGKRLNELVKNSLDIENLLPPHSEGYEETVLDTLLTMPKTFQELESLIPAKSITRVLNRLQKAGLVETAKENDYIFYFKTKRDPKKAKFSPTERKVYDNIPAEGISARKLAQKTGITLRRTYKYLKRLKRKKLVFTRKKPKTYALTGKGLETATMLREIHELTIETLATAALLVNDKETYRMLMPDTLNKRRRKEKEAVQQITIKHNPSNL